MSTKNLKRTKYNISFIAFSCAEKNIFFKYGPKVEETIQQGSSFVGLYTFTITSACLWQGINMDVANSVLRETVYRFTDKVAFSSHSY